MRDPRYTGGPEDHLAEGLTAPQTHAPPGTVAVRDAKNADGPILRLAPRVWAPFVAYVGVSPVGRSRS
ncbi:DUF397 domain-containing protein [Streptomyces spinoverrucosus]|uniref:DUF397 domain-containing protein n=1 Tax=Streptomyces spinoverrucosus TaxID=284043 RepID=UPI0018C433D6|nr:DUF397 domain-containing protein [Streptomyces spinoverrucosus]MBG0853817.1 DUF397 domain-containing protein [Streptomyces spinoverrucosus]